MTQTDASAGSFFVSKLSIMKPRLHGSQPPNRLQPVKSNNREHQRAERRGTSAERGYGGWWQRQSTAFRKQFPNCAYCWLQGRDGPAELVDHLYPHGIRKGFQHKDAKRLFRKRECWVSSCNVCHNGYKAQIEKQGIDAIDNLAVKLGVAILVDEGMRYVCTLALMKRQGGGYR